MGRHSAHATNVQPREQWTRGWQLSVREPSHFTVKPLSCCWALRLLKSRGSMKLLVMFFSTTQECSALLCLYYFFQCSLIWSSINFLHILLSSVGCNQHKVNKLWKLDFSLGLLSLKTAAVPFPLPPSLSSSLPLWEILLLAHRHNALPLLQQPEWGKETSQWQGTPQGGCPQIYQFW